MIKFTNVTRIFRDEKGIALITTLILSFVAVAFIYAMLYLTNSVTNISGAHKRYQNALMAAKGTSEYIMDYVLAGKESQICGGTCYKGQKIPDLNNITSGYVISVDVLDRSHTVLSATKEITIYSFRVTATRNTIKKNKEKAIIEFVYKIE